MKRIKDDRLRIFAVEMIIRKLRPRTAREVGHDF
jgi:hypothetical protein